MLSKVLGVLLIAAFISRFVVGAYIGYRDGVVRQRIQAPWFRDGDQYYEGDKARRYGWYSVIAGSAMVILILGLVLYLLKDYFIYW